MFSFSPNVKSTTDRPIWSNSKSCVPIISLKAGKTLTKAEAVFGAVLCFKVLPFVVEETTMKDDIDTRTRPVYALFQVRMRQSEHTDTLVDILVNSVGIHYDRQWANHTTAISTISTATTVGQASLCSVINGYERELRVICFASFNPLYNSLLESAKQIMKKRTYVETMPSPLMLLLLLSFSNVSYRFLFAHSNAWRPGECQRKEAVAACRQGLPHWQCARNPKDGLTILASKAHRCLDLCYHCVSNLISL